VERKIPRAADSADTVVGETSSPVTVQTSHIRQLLPSTRARYCMKKRRNFVSEFAWEDLLSISAEMCIILSLGPLCGCERSGATRGGFSRKSHETSLRSVMQMETRGQVTAKTSVWKRNTKHHDDRIKLSWKTHFPNQEVAQCLARVHDMHELILAPSPQVYHVR
jgi:hypothetical protein